MEPLTDSEEQALAVIIDKRKEKPITGKDVADAIGLKIIQTGKEGADMREIINSLRIKGYPICASGLGYYWPVSKEELLEYIKSFAGRIRAQEEALAAMRNGFDKIGQDVTEVLENVPRPTTHKV